ncbi:hypothetical protein MATL_G00192810 [Megalops atlanticus]|uniref:Pyrin domain-containing protein n=1 Tax=Megalops atlanticus TaxID=7932 RepID=A0A9D3PKX6_MEGAT|nr:hypothetical protein MATL_G00192810 [Megalops atlanticus]
MNARKRKKGSPDCEMTLSAEPEAESGTFDPTGKRVQLERAGSPVPSCLSMKSNHSMNPPLQFRGDARVQLERAGSPVPSCLSMKSNHSMNPPLQFRGDARVEQLAESDQFMDLTLTKKSIQRTMKELERNELKQFQSHLSRDYSECFEGQLDDCEVQDVVEKMLKSCGRQKSLKITLDTLRDIKQRDLADSLEREEKKNEAIIRDQQKLKSELKKKFECIFEGLAKQGHPTLFKEIYTELYITEGGSGERLGLSGCQITEEGCASLASALHSNPSHLRELDLSYNHPGDSGKRALSTVLEDPSYKLERLLMDHGGENRNKPGLRKYYCHLTLDSNTANRLLCLSEGDRKLE